MTRTGPRERRALDIKHQGCWNTKATPSQTMLGTFDLILIMCGATGAVMVVGSILLLYQGVIKLSEQSTGRAVEAEFKNQLKINIRNPALALFAIGFAFFGLALYFGKSDSGPLIVSVQIKMEDLDSGI